MAGSDAPLLLCGFGPFAAVRENPSGRVAAALAAEPGVHSAVLPVTFGGAPRVFDAALAALAPRIPVALVGLGVHRGAGFRLERRARRELGSPQPDLEGICAADLQLAGPPELRSACDLQRLAAQLEAAGAGVVPVSDDAGGYVCECLYRHALAAGEQLGIPAVFLHVPPLAAVALEDQVRVVRALLCAIRSGA